MLTLTDAGAEKLAELYPAWRSAQQQAHELLGAGVAASIRRRVDDAFAEPARGRVRSEPSEPRIAKLLVQPRPKRKLPA